MSGKSKCKILKQIRQQIAAENDIEFITSECKFQGECSGTCPKCEAEVRYLEQQLLKRRQAGKAVAVAGIAAALIVSASGCIEPRTGGAPLPPSQSQTEDIPGGILPTEDLMGVPVEEITQPTEPTELVEGELIIDEPLMGDPVPEE
jgi:hypothetical protein